MFEANYTVGGRLDAPHYPTFTVPYMTGVIKHMNPISSGQIEYVVPFIGELFAVSLDTSTYQNDDNWDLTVDGTLLADKIYMKRAPEGVNLMSHVQVVPGSRIVIDFRNAGAEKDVWVTFHFLKEGDLSKPLPVLPPPSGGSGLSPIKVAVHAIRLYVFDTSAVDGDTLSIYLNGAKVKENLAIQMDQAGVGQNGVNYIEIPLRPGDNEIEFEAVSAGTSKSLSGAFRVTDTNGNVIYNKDQLPSLGILRTAGNGVIEPGGEYIDPKPRVRWVINRTV